MHIAESEKNGLPADKIGQKKWTKMGQFWQSLRMYDPKKHRFQDYESIYQKTYLDT